MHLCRALILHWTSTIMYCITFQCDHDLAQRRLNALSLILFQRPHNEGFIFGIINNVTFYLPLTFHAGRIWWMDNKKKRTNERIFSIMRIIALLLTFVCFKCSFVGILFGFLSVSEMSKVVKRIAVIDSTSSATQNKWTALPYYSWISIIIWRKSI